MGVADCMNIWSCLMNSGMDQESSGIGWSGTVPTNDFAVEVNEDHITSLEKSEVNAERVCPECVVMLRISNGDVTGYAEDIAFS